MFYVFIKQEMTDGTAPMATVTYEDEIQARMRYHQEMAAALANENVNALLVKIFTGSGAEVLNDYFVRPVEPEPTPDPDEGINY